MSWYERISQWISGQRGASDAEGDLDALEGMVTRLEGSISGLRGRLAALMAAHREAASALERLMAEEARWEKAAREALETGRPAEAKRCLARQFAAAEETKDFSAEVERRRQDLERARAMLAELEDLIGQTRMRRDTLLAKERLRTANQALSRAIDDTRAADRQFIRGWDRFERAAEEALTLLGGVGARKDAAEGGLAPSPDEPAPDRAAPPPAPPKPDIDAELSRMAAELRAPRRGKSAREEELDRLLDELDRRG